MSVTHSPDRLAKCINQALNFITEGAPADSGKLCSAPTDSLAMSIIISLVRLTLSRISRPAYVQACTHEEDCMYKSSCSNAVSLEMLRQMHKIGGVPPEITGCMYTHDQESRKAISSVITSVFSKTKTSLDKVYQQVHEFATRNYDAFHGNAVRATVYYTGDKKCGTTLVAMLDPLWVFHNFQPRAQAEPTEGQARAATGVVRFSAAYSERVSGWNDALEIPLPRARTRPEPVAASNKTVGNEWCDLPDNVPMELLLRSMGPPPVDYGSEPLPPNEVWDNPVLAPPPPRPPLVSSSDASSVSTDANVDPDEIDMLSRQIRTLREEVARKKQAAERALEVQRLRDELARLKQEDALLSQQLAGSRT